MRSTAGHGVLGMARITGTGASSVFSIRLFGTDAATEMINCRGEIWPRSSATTSSTTCGFTPIKMTSASLAACKLFDAHRYAELCAQCLGTVFVSHRRGREFWREQAVSQQRLEQYATHLARPQHRDFLA